MVSHRGYQFQDPFSSYYLLKVYIKMLNSAPCITLQTTIIYSLLKNYSKRYINRDLKLVVEWIRANKLQTLIQTFYTSGNWRLALFLKIMQSCFGSKRIKQRVVKCLVPFFSKKVPFLANIGCCPDFLDLGPEMCLNTSKTELVIFKPRNKTIAKHLA